MRYVKSPLGLFALLFVAVSVLACGGGEEAPAVDSSAAAAAAPPPPPEAFAVMAKDASWSVDINPASILWKKLKGRKDSIVFDYKAPNVNGAILEYTSVRMAADTHRIDITLSMVPCTDNSKNSYTHIAQVWVDQVAYSGCATKK
jgi:uncharacterized membrane protein